MVVQGGSELVTRDGGSNIALLRTRNWEGRTGFRLNPLGQGVNSGDLVHGYGSEIEALEGELASETRVTWSGGGLPSYEGYRVNLTKGRATDGMAGGGLFDRSNRLIGVISGVSVNDCSVAFFGRLNAFAGLRRLNDPESNESDPQYGVQERQIPSVRTLRIEAGNPSDDYAERDQRASHYSSASGSGFALGSARAKRSAALQRPRPAEREPRQGNRGG